MKLFPSLRRMYFSMMLLVALSVIGVIGFSYIEKYSSIDAIYMTVITMSTVGFGTVKELSPDGKIFSVGLIIMSAGTFLYAISTITTFVVEGELRDLFKHYRITKKVARLKDHIIICGLGRNGRETALELLRQGQQFVVVENDTEVVDDFLLHHESDGALAILGDATLEEVLEQANIQSARGLISAVSTDAENVYIALTAREMNPRMKIIARASTEATITKLKRAGANDVIVPNLIGGRKMANLITRPALVEFVEIISGQHGTQYQLEDFLVGESKYMVGKTIADLQVRSRTGATVIGLKSGAQQIELTPSVQKRLDADDRLFVLGKGDSIKKFRTEYYT